MLHAHAVRVLLLDCKLMLLIGVHCMCVPPTLAVSVRASYPPRLGDGSKTQGRVLAFEGPSASDPGGSG
jgi:hypothetical protein